MKSGVVDPEQLPSTSSGQARRNRKTATIFGTVSIAGLILMVFIIVNYFPEEADMTLMIVSFLAYLVVVAIVGGYWIRVRKRRQQERARDFKTVIGDR